MLIKVLESHNKHVYYVIINIVLLTQINVNKHLIKSYYILTEAYYKDLNIKHYRITEICLLKNTEMYHLASSDTT